MLVVLFLFKVVLYHQFIEQLSEPFVKKCGTLPAILQVPNFSSYS